MEIVKEEEITVFMVDLNPKDGYFNTFICEKCIKQAKKVFSKSKFKIYTPDDEIVKKCLEEYKEAFDFIDLKKKKNMAGLMWKADIIRIYILSKLKNHLYLDSDIFLDNVNIDINENSIKSQLEKSKGKFLNNNFSIIWNGEDLKTFEKFLHFYKNDFFKKNSIYNDSAVCAELKNTNIFEKYFKHYHYSEVIMFKNGKIKYLPVTREKIEIIKQFKSKKDLLLKNVILTKQFKDLDEPYCEEDVIYWGYIFNTFEDFKEYALKNKPEGTTIEFI